MEQVIVVGRLGAAPELKYFGDGNAVCNFSLAVDSGQSAPGGGYVTHWFRVATWGKQAENCNQYLGKGSQVAVVGRLQSDERGNPRTFTRNNGEAGASYELTASIVRFLDSRNAQDGDAEFEPAKLTTEDLDEIAF